MYAVHSVHYYTIVWVLIRSENAPSNWRVSNELSNSADGVVTVLKNEVTLLTSQKPEDANKDKYVASNPHSVVYGHAVGLEERNPFRCWTPVPLLAWPIEVVLHGSHVACQEQ